MKWFSHGIAWILLIGLVIMAPILPQKLPNTSEGIAAEVYARWAGVLRIWVCTGWTPGGGSLTPWLNKAIAKFERNNPGVYVQLQPVSEAILASFAAGDINPPDAMIFSPGILSSASGLLALDTPNNLLSCLRDAGEVDETVYATPIAMGGYAWAINTRMLSSAPVGEIPQPEPDKKGNISYIMQAPDDGTHVSWSGALLSLCLYEPSDENGEIQKVPVGEGMDLGLEPPVTEATPSPAELEEAHQAELILSFPSLRPENFRKTASVVTDFQQGRAASIPVSQTEMKRLEVLADGGRMVDYQIVPGLGAFTDQLAMYAIVNVEKNDLESRQALCKTLMGLLLDDSIQLALSSVRAMRVTEGAIIYTGQQSMAALERGYTGREIKHPNAFDKGYQIQLRNQLNAALSQH